MTLGNHQEAFMQDVANILAYLHDNGYTVRGGDLQRSKEQQKIYFNQGKSKTLKSNHLLKCAVDLHIFRNGRLLQDKHDLQAIGDYWEALNNLNRWGGNFKTFLDVPHFERNIQPYFL
ncbi:M15 family metallopeptidase [Campylobacter sp. RM9328]|uniref:M15 family metallopeptidase n=1 Tax=Campylobacter sp. RM9328 TaxID=1705720 RepID=UPI0014766D1C|nr:M15 family metallopeptidase [Campylobacter sp. RM9328]